jgi:glutamate racemase
MKIGVFDSGAGGLAIAQAIEKALPNEEVLYVNDHDHVPYGDKTPEQLLGFVEPILQKLVEQDSKVIVIACNTVTTTIISELRERIQVPLVGIEPMVKPAAAATKTGVITVCATPATLKSPRYAWLKQTYATGLKVLEPDCSQWARMIEDSQVNEQKIEVQINEICQQNADVIVLGCTHYHWIEATIDRMAAGRAKVIQPEQAVVAQLKRVVAKLQTTER